MGPGSALVVQLCRGSYSRAGATHEIVVPGEREVPMKPSVARNLDLDTALAEARRCYIEANPASRARQEDAQAALPGG